MIFYHVSNPRSNPPQILVCATTDVEHDVLITMHNPSPPSSYLPSADVYRDIPSELLLTTDLELRTTYDLRRIQRHRHNRNFDREHWDQLAASLRDRLSPSSDLLNPLLRHAVRQFLLSLPLSFYPETTYFARDKRIPE